MDLVEYINLIFAKQNETNNLLSELLKRLAKQVQSTETKPDTLIDFSSLTQNPTIQHSDVIDIPQPVSIPKTQPAPIVVEEKEEFFADQLNEFDSLKNALFSNAWPYAVEPEYICDNTSEVDKQDRAQGIIAQMLNKPVKGLKVLDFGCGCGHTITEFNLRGAALAVGYDIKQYENPNFVWEEQKDQQLLTTNFQKVIDNGPYDIAFVYDVLDHIENELMVDALRKINSVLKSGARIYIRCHPFISRHGGHLYLTLNKAFAHLVFTETELNEMGYVLEHSQRVVKPQITYSAAFNLMPWIREALFIDKSPIEPFFTQTPIILNRILSNCNLKREHNIPEGQMEQTFLDYIYIKK